MQNICSILSKEPLSMNVPVHASGASKGRAQPPSAGRDTGRIPMPKSAKDGSAAHVMETVEKEGVRWLDLWFVDLLGSLQHITVPANPVKEEDFKDGSGKLDGAPIKGVKEDHEA